MKTFSTSLEIHASCQRVWDVLIEDLTRDPRPFGIIRIDGKIAPGGRIKLWSEVDPKRAFALRVVTMVAPEIMIWKGGMPLGLFSGTRTFHMRCLGHSTQFEMQEVFDGVLAKLITRSIPDLTPSFEKFARTLKEKAESDG